MLLSDWLELEEAQSESTVTFDQPEQKNASQFRDAQRAQDKFEVKSVCQDTFEHVQIEQQERVQNINEALSLLRSLRDGSQISDSAHDSLSKAFKLFSKKEERVASHSDKADGAQCPSKHSSPETIDGAVLTTAVIHAPERRSASRPFKDPSSKRRQLTSEEAAEIYSMRPSFAKGSTLRKGCMVKSKMIAPHFGVTAKTVRDIWHARTWACATRHLWTEEEIVHHAKGALGSEDEDINNSSGSASPAASMDNMKLHPYMHNWLQNQAMMGGMSGLPFHLPLACNIDPSAHPFSMEQQHAAMSGFLTHAFASAAQHAPMAFAGGHPGLGKAAHKRAFPKAPASRRKVSTTQPH